MQIAPWVFPLTEETASIPPHVRGKAFLNTGTSSAPGITPACAGKSATSCRCRGSAWDHPRVCGEKSFTKAISKPDWGSPPRVRGKGTPCIAKASFQRITPACAGKRRCQGLSAYLHQDHPRVCGEKSSVSRTPHIDLGSPPRVRGKGCADGQRTDYRRITPACAGKSI